MRFKLGAAFAAVLIILGGVALFALASLEEMKGRTDEMVEQDLAKAMWAKEIIANTLEVAGRVYSAATTTEDAGIANEISTIETLRASNTEHLKRLDETIHSEHGRELLVRVTEARSRVSETYAPLYALLRAKNTSGSLDFIRQHFNPNSDALVAALKEIGDYQMLRMNNAVTANDAQHTKASRLVIGVLACGLLLCITLSVTLNRLVQGPLNVAQACARRMADGDLGMDWRGVRINGDELGQTLAALRAMQASMNTMLGQIARSANEVGRAAGNVAASAQEVSQASSAQSEASSSSAAAMEQLTVSIDQVAQNADQASVKASEADRLGAAGGAAVDAAGESTRDIATRIENTAEYVAGLSADLKRIGSVSGAIREVADQTNLLALNAAIEAARAGEHGKGFAVVADEVRKLAERTARSAGEIAGMVESVELRAGEAVAAMQNSRNAVSGVLANAEEAVDSVSKSRQGAQATQVAMQAIRDTLAEQLTASAQIARHIESIAQAAEENNAAANAANEESQRLLKESRSLAEAVGSFRLAV
jgi:methyl-accepting chemotaxis protein